MTLRLLARFAAALAFALPITALAQSAPELDPRTAETDLPLDDTRSAMTLPHVALAFDVDPASRSIAGRGVYTVHASETLDMLAFDLDPRFAVSAITYDRGGAMATLSPADWANVKGRLRIRLPEPLQANDQAEVTIAWSGQPHIATNPPWNGGFTWSRTPGGEPWIATSVQGEGCDLFWPCLDHSSKRIGLLDLAVTVPEGLVAAGNGALVREVDNGDTTTFHWRARDPSNYGVTLQIGPYELAERSYESRFGNTIPLMFWHLPGNSEGANRLLDEMVTYLDFFEEVIGPYPFADEKAGVAETPHLGMEHQTINAYGNAYRRDPLGYDWLLHHEFSHEWFANQLTNETVNHMWLHEGIGTWMQPLYLGWLRGEMFYDAEMWSNRQRIVARTPLVTRDGALQDYGDSESGWGIDIYMRGAWTMHTLRYVVGDDVLFPALRRLTYGTDDPQPGEIRPVNRTTDDFRAILEEMSGRDLQWFFDTYFYEAGLPRLNQWRENDTLWLEWQTTSSIAFEMPLEVRVGEETVRVPMTGGRGRVSLPDYDTSWLVDPRNQVLMYDEAIEAARR